MWQCEGPVNMAPLDDASWLQRHPFGWMVCVHDSRGGSLSALQHLHPDISDQMILRWCPLFQISSRPAYFFKILFVCSLSTKLLMEFSIKGNPHVSFSVSTKKQNLIDRLLYKVSNIIQIMHVLCTLWLFRPTGKSHSESRCAPLKAANTLLVTFCLFELWGVTLTDLSLLRTWVAKLAQ